MTPRFVLKKKTQLTDKQQRNVKKITVKNNAHGQDVTIELENRMLALDRLAEVTGTIKTESNNAEYTREEQAAQLRDTLAAMRSADNGDDWNAENPAPLDEEKQTA